MIIMLGANEVHKVYNKICKLGVICLNTYYQHLKLKTLTVNYF